MKRTAWQHIKKIIGVVITPGRKDIGDRSVSLRNGLKGLETELQELHI